MHNQRRKEDVIDFEMPLSHWVELTALRSLYSIFSATILKSFALRASCVDRMRTKSSSVRISKQAGKDLNEAILIHKAMHSILIITSFSNFKYPKK